MSDLPDCLVPADRRVAPDWMERSLTALADLDENPARRAASVDACAINGNISRVAADWLLRTMERNYPGSAVPIGIRAMPNASGASRSDHIVAICRIIGHKRLAKEIRHEAASTLVHYCHDEGYREVRRLLPANWAWLTDATKRHDWAKLLAVFFVDDTSAPLKTRIDVATALIETTEALVLPPGFDDLVLTNAAPGAVRIRLAKLAASVDRKSGRRFLEAIADDTTVSRSHRAEAALLLRSEDG